MVLSKKLYDSDQHGNCHLVHAQIIQSPYIHAITSQRKGQSIWKILYSTSLSFPLAQLHSSMLLNLFYICLSSPFSMPFDEITDPETIYMYK